MTGACDPARPARDRGRADDRVERFRLVPAAYLVLRHGGQVLLQLRQHTGYLDGYWACGSAGHVERGESVLACAVREAREELRIQVDPGDLLPLCAMHRTGSGAAIDERVDFFFAVHRWVGEPAVGEPSKVADLRWFDLGDLPPNLVPHERVVLDALAGGSVPAVSAYGFGGTDRRGRQ